MSTTLQHHAKPSHKNRKWNRNRIGRGYGKESFYALRHGGLALAKAKVKRAKARTAERMTAYFAARQEHNNLIQFERTAGRTALRMKAAENIYPLR
jgi:hypothetical protein